MFELLKSKATIISNTEMCIEYLAFKIGPERAQKEATNVAMFIWIGLGRMINEGIPAKFFGDIAKSEAHKIMHVGDNISDDEFISAAKNSISLMFFDLFENGRLTKDRLAIFNKIIDYLCMFSQGEPVKEIINLLQLSIPESRYKKIQNIAPFKSEAESYILDLKNENHLEYAEACIAFNVLDDKGKLRTLNFCHSILNDSISYFGKRGDIIKLREVDFLLLRSNLAEIESKKPSTYPLMTFLGCSFRHWREDGQSFDKVFLSNWNSLLEALETGCTAISFIAPDLATGIFPEPLTSEPTKKSPALNTSVDWPFPSGSRP